MDKRDGSSPQAQPTDWLDRRGKQIRGSFQRLGWITKLLASVAAAIIAIGGVATAIIAIVDFVERVKREDPPNTSVPYLGIRAQDLTPAQLDFHMSPSDLRRGLTSYGILVIEVYPDGPASRAEVKSEDIITDINGERVDSVRDLQRILRKKQPGVSLQLSIVRDKRRILIRGVTLESAEVATFPEGQNQKYENLLAT